jgi:hypothetical protein
MVIAHDVIEGEQALHMKSFVPISDSTYETVHVVEELGADGSAVRRSEVTAQLAFDSPIALDGEGGCVVTARYEHLSYQRTDASGRELPEAERETMTVGESEPLPCHVAPSELGREIRVMANFFEGAPPPDAVLDLLQPLIWLDPEHPDVLFMQHWVFRYDVLPQGL